MAWTTELGPIQTIAVGDTIPMGWWFSTNDFEALFGGVNATISAGQHFYSDGTAVLDPGGWASALIQPFIFAPGTQGPPIEDATVPPSIPGIHQPVFAGGSATNPSPPINITGSPIIPTSTAPGLTGTGQIGNPVGVPVFPPPTPPPIGEVPTGPLVGPAVAAAPVPPSLAGVVQPSFATGSKTVPLPSALFPAFTTAPYATFPTTQPIIVPNIWNIATMTAGAWVMNAPPSTPTNQLIILDGWGPPGPQNGVGPPVYPQPPGTGLPHVGELRSGHAEPAERHRRADVSDPDDSQLHQPEPSEGRSRKRVSSNHSSRRSNAA